MAKLHYVEGFKDDIVKYWEVFEDDRQVKRFLTTSPDFENCVIDDENVAE